jgi:acetyl-CoA decarbonylase/synthase complex subunit gamma
VGFPNLNQPFVIGSIQTISGKVTQVSSHLFWADRVGSWKARWGIGRMHYTVEPGLYALGNPDAKSPVLVTASYKMSFDRLRAALPEKDAWILVLDTKGINVWCAAGKGTFGTRELTQRVAGSGLDRIVCHRELILPQLSAPGIAAHEVKKLSGFKVIYGPIKAEDLAEFLNNGMRATPEMRIKTFTALERMVLIPIELVSAIKVMVAAIFVLVFLSGILGPGSFLNNALHYGLVAVPALATAVMAGAVLAPLLLPWLPGRAFSIKGLPLGILGALVLLSFHWSDFDALGGGLQLIAWLFLVPSATTYLSMNFTGASTYTSLSGVKKEMRFALPFQIGMGILGLAFWFSSLLVG